MEQNKNYIEVTARFNLDCINSMLSHFGLRVGNLSTEATETQHGAAVGLTEAKSEQGDEHPKKRTHSFHRWTPEMEECLVANNGVHPSKLAEELNTRHGLHLTSAAVSCRVSKIRNNQRRRVFTREGAKIIGGDTLL